MRTDLSKFTIFFFFTTLGSVLTTIACFLTAEETFKLSYVLPAALSIKTLSSVIFASKITHLFEKWDLKISLLFSEFMGIISIASLFAGIKLQSPYLFLTGIGFSMLPSIGLRNSFITLIRLTEESHREFKKKSGKMQSLIGMAFLISTVMAPTLLKFIGIYNILIIDLISFIAMLVFIFFSELSFNSQAQDKKPTETKTISFSLKTKVMVGVFAISVLSGLLPIAASSNKDMLNISLDTFYRDYIWTVEALIMIFTGQMYAFLNEHKVSKYTYYLSYISCCFVFALLSISSTSVMFFITLIFITLVSNFGFIYFRDHLIVNSEKSLGVTSRMTALGQMGRSLAMAVSPIIISYVLTNHSQSFFIIFITVQLLLSLIYFFLSAAKSQN
jgi:MFS family permease